MAGAVLQQRDIRTLYAASHSLCFAAAVFLLVALHAYKRINQT